MINLIENRHTVLLNKEAFLKENIILSVDNYKLSLRKRKLEEHLLLKRSIQQIQVNEFELNTFINISSIPFEVKESIIHYDERSTIPQFIEKCSQIAQRITKYLSNPNILMFLLDQSNKLLALIRIESLPLITTTKLIESLHSILPRYQTNHSIIVSIYSI